MLQRFIMKSAPEIFRGYELFAPAMLLPAVVNVADFDPERRLEKGGVLDIPGPHHVLRGSIEWLHSQGILRLIDGQIQATEKGKTLFSLSGAIAEYTSRYDNILATLEVLLSWREGPVPKLPGVFANGSRFAIDSLIPPAVTFLHECPSKKDPGITLSKALQSGQARLDDLLPEDIREADIAPFLAALKKRDLLQARRQGVISLTDRGRKVLGLGGFAELITSYYTAFGHLTGLANGKLRIERPKR